MYIKINSTDLAELILADLIVGGFVSEFDREDAHSFIKSEIDAQTEDQVPITTIIKPEEINIGISKVPIGYCIGCPNGGYMASSEEGMDIVGTTIPETLGNFLLRIKELYVECDPVLPMPYIKSITFDD